MVVFRSPTQKRVQTTQKGVVPVIYRIIVQQSIGSGCFKVFNLETAGEVDMDKVRRYFCNPAKERLYSIAPGEHFYNLPTGKFLEVMYHNGVVDPEQEQIIKGCEAYGVVVEAVKVGNRYYGSAMKGVVVNKLVHISFTSEPELTTLKPRGSRRGMQLFDLTTMSDDQLLKLSKDRSIGLTLEQMRKLVDRQKQQQLPAVTDVYLESFGAKWSDHCVHLTWEELGIFKILKSATNVIANSNLVSAFVDNAGGWKLWDGLVAVFKLETHNSPTAKEPYGGQLTKFGGVIRDILGYGLGALCVGNMELTAIGEFVRVRYPQLDKFTLKAQTIAQETIRAVRDYGNPMGIPMLLARMISHPCFTCKPFALGGTIGITREEHAQKGTPLKGDLMILVGGRTGNDGLHGATISSGELHENVDTGDASHVQIGNPYVEQKMMPAQRHFKHCQCIRAVTDCGAAGILMAGSELGEDVAGVGGAIMNLAAVPLKCAGLENWQILLSESQERMIYAVIPNKFKDFIKICKKYELEASVIGIYTDSGNFQVIYDPEIILYRQNMALSGEICLDVPYAFFKDCPLPRLEVIEPPQIEKKIEIPITIDNVAAMALKVVGHFDVCDQSWATTQYDSTVQGKTARGPLYGVNYNVPTHLAAVFADYGKPFGPTVSWSFSPWQFESDPVNAAINALLDAVATQVLAGVEVTDICLADNFYTPNKDKYAYWYLTEQVKAIATYSEQLRTPFITGKDSSSGSATYGNTTVNVLPCVAITAMGRHPNLPKLIPHQWQRPGNLIYSVGRQFKKLDGSILSSSLGMTGNQLETVHPWVASRQMSDLDLLSQSRLTKSAVPINRGGIIMRLFEGVEATGYGIKTDLCQELFPESMGSGLVEISPTEKDYFLDEFGSLEPVLVGEIIKKKGIIVQGQPLPWQLLRQAWKTTFKKEVMSR